MDKYICIHAHFYQPPRENPWLEEIELQDSAYPYHDWNERISAECYAQNTASRILDPDENIIEIVNNYSKISFNFGPTLLCWMKKHKADVYQAILEADRLSRERFSGHGSAIAQVYNHMIMPLANKKDKYTQVIWGIKDFQRRFGRFPEGMWLPETAVDLQTLEVLSELGIKFTILAPVQASRVKKLGKSTKFYEVKDGRIDPTMTYLCQLPSGRSINLFFYDGPISHEIAFGGLLNDGEAFAKRLLDVFDYNKESPQIVHIATDGETYGHHHRHGDMALAYCLYFIESDNLARITNYGEYLEKHPPTYMVEIFENSSWSCIHGVERWRDNCGCNSGMHRRWNQSWRKPLREAMDWLRDRLIPPYEEESAKYLGDPWSARNDYIEVILDRSRENVERFFEKHAIKALSKEDKARVLKLLEMQRNAMLMYTSCGWFFDEISGIETTQVLQYAARAIQLAEAISGISLEPHYKQALEKAPTNIPQFENGSRIYEMFAKPAMIDLLRVGAHYAISSLFEEYPDTTGIYSYTTNSQLYEKKEAGKSKLAIGRTRIVSDITWDEACISFAVLHLGDHNFNGGVRNYMGEESFAIMQNEITEAFNYGHIPDVIRLMDKHFDTNNYSLWHLFKDEQRKVLNQILQSTLGEIEVSFRQIYENNYSIMNFLQSLQIPLPKPLQVSVEYIINAELKKIFETEEEINTEKLEDLVRNAKRWSVEIDRATISLIAIPRILSLMEKLNSQPEDIPLFESITSVLKLLNSLPVELDLWKVQNLYFFIEKKLFGSMKDRAEKGDNLAQIWMETFHNLGYYLHVKIPQ